MKSHRLDYFCKVTEFGSFSRAAIALGINQSALSRHITNLEKELGVPLFYRNGRGIIPTEQGTRLFLRASKALEELRSAQQEVMRSGDTALNSVVIGMPPTLGRVLVRPVTERLLAKFPDAKLRFLEGLTGNVIEWIDEGRVDIAVFYGSWATHRLGAEVLMEEKLCLISSKDAPRLGDTVSSAILGKVPLIAPSHVHGLRRRLEVLAAEQNLTLDIRIEADSLDLILALVKAGFGRCLLPEQAVRGELLRGEIQLTELVAPEVTRSMILAAPNNHPRVHGFHEVATAIKAEIEIMLKNKTTKN